MCVPAIVWQQQKDKDKNKILPIIGPPGGGSSPCFAHGGADELLGGGGGGPPPGMGTGVLIRGLGPGGAAQGGGPEDGAGPGGGGGRSWFVFCHARRK